MAIFLNRKSVENASEFSALYACNHCTYKLPGNLQPGNCSYININNSCSNKPIRRISEGPSLELNVEFLLVSFTYSSTLYVFACFELHY